MLQRMDTVHVLISDWLKMMIEFTAVCCWENLELFQKMYFNPMAGINCCSFIRENDLFVEERVKHKLCR